MMIMTVMIPSCRDLETEWHDLVYNLENITLASLRRRTSNSGNYYSGPGMG